MRHCETCILGQVYGDFYFVVSPATNVLTLGQAVDFGFYIDLFSPDTLSYEELTEEWKAALS